MMRITQILETVERRLLRWVLSCLRNRNPVLYRSLVTEAGEGRDSKTPAMGSCAWEQSGMERENLETVTQNCGVGICVISKDFRVVWLNRVMKSVFGNVEGTLCFSSFNKQDHLCPGCGVQTIFQTGREKAVHEQKGWDVNGNPAWFEMTATPIRDSHGTIIGAMEAVVPITERKRVEEQLKNSVAELAQFNKLAVGRELRMIELKRQINDLARELGRPELYDLSSVNAMEGTPAHG